MDSSVQDALNEQIGQELYAAYLYLAMSAHCDRMSLSGFASWMQLQGREELEHALRLVAHMNRRGAITVFGEVEAPPASFGNPVAMFESALAHERKVSALINGLYDLAMEKHDHATQLELQWFITEQVEEEDSIGAVVDQLRMAGENEAAVLMLDQRLATRMSAG
jgi:ferritin